MTLYNAFGDLRTQSTLVGPAVNSGVLGTAVNASLEIDVTDASGVMVFYRSSSTAGGAITIEGIVDTADANTWSSLTYVRTETSPTIITGIGPTLASSTNYRFRVDVNGLTRIRLRVTTTLGAALSNLSYVKHIDVEPLYSVTVPNGTQAVSGTVTANVTNPTGSAYSAVTTASTNFAVVKASAGSLYELSVSNITGTAVFVKLYNKATAPTTSDVPVMTISVAANTTTPILFGGIGKRFTTGIGIGATGAAPANDGTAAVAGVQLHGTYV